MSALLTDNLFEAMMAYIERVTELETKTEKSPSEQQPKKEEKEAMTKGMDKEKDDGAFKGKDITVRHHGTAIVLPAAPRPMTYREGIDNLQRMEQQEQVDVGIHEEVDVFPLEGAWALNKVLEAMLRAGRLDAVIHVAAPDEEAAMKLMRIYARGLIGEKEDLSGAAKELRGQIPAFIREVVERAKLYAIGRMKEGEKLSLSGEDLRVAAFGMKEHFRLVNRGPKRLPTVAERLEHSLAAVVQKVYSDSYQFDDNMVVERDHTLQPERVQ